MGLVTSVHDYGPAEPSQVRMAGKHSSCVANVYFTVLSTFEIIPTFPAHDFFRKVYKIRHPAVNFRCGIKKFS